MGEFCVLELVLEYDFERRRKGDAPCVAAYLARCPGDSERHEFIERLEDLDFAFHLVERYASTGKSTENAVQAALLRRVQNSSLRLV